MKKRNVIFLFAILFLTIGGYAQKKFAEAKYTQMCSYYGETVTGTIHAYEADGVTETVVQNIMSTIGLHSNFELRAANVPNAASVILKGKRYILYNPKFMSQINSASGSDWAAVSILAHEIGHHLSGHTLDNVGSRPETELEADEFSGFVLRRMGASLPDAQAVMETIASLKGSHSHPPKKDRLAAIEKGWSKAGGTVISNTAIADNKPVTESKPKSIAVRTSPEVSKPKATVPKTTAKPVAKATPKPEKTREEKIAESAMSSQNIASDAYFGANPKGKYYLTVKGNLVLVDKDKVYMIASLAASNKQGYKMMLTDNESVYLYISSDGYLINGSGNKVGFLKARQ